MKATINKALYDALREAGASEEKAEAAATHDVVSELGAIRTELRWMKAMGVGVIAGMGGIYWKMLELASSVAVLAERLAP